MDCYHILYNKLLTLKKIKIIERKEYYRWYKFTLSKVIIVILLLSNFFMEGKCS